MSSTIAVSVFFLVVLNVAASVMQVDAQYFEVGAASVRARVIYLDVALLEACRAS